MPTPEDLVDLKKNNTKKTRDLPYLDITDKVGNMTASTDSIVNDYLSPTLINKVGKNSGVHVGDEISLFGIPREPDPMHDIQVRKPSFIEIHFLSMFQPTENRIAMKLFGSKKALQDEQNRQRAAGLLIIHPLSKFRYIITKFLIKLYSTSLCLKSRYHVLRLYLTLFHNMTRLFTYYCYS